MVLALAKSTSDFRLSCFLIILILRYLNMIQTRLLLAILFMLFLPGLSAGESTRPGIHFGVMSISPPARSHADWQPFARYLSRRLGVPVHIVVPRGFERMKQAILNRELDIFYINSYILYLLKQEGMAVGIAQMENVEGQVIGRSEIFVRGDSDITQPEHLKYKRIAFVSPMGAGGYLAARAYLYRHGVQTARDSEEVFTRNLMNSIHQVLLGESDAGSMCGVNYRLMSEKVDTGELRILGVTEDYPENLIAAHTDLPPRYRQRIADLIVSMDRDPRGQAVLADMRAMKIGRFIEYDPATEDITRALLEQAQLLP